MLSGRLTHGRKLLGKGSSTRLMSWVLEDQPERSGTWEGAQHTQNTAKSYAMGWIPSSVICKLCTSFAMVSLFVKQQ